MQLKHIPIDQLKVSKLNMRHGRKTPDISDILPSVRQSGIHQPLLVRQRKDKTYGVVAGRRRYFALKQVAKETCKTIKVPCGIMKSGDNAAAIEASLLENIARLPATEMEQYTAFRVLAGKGRTVPEIAATFGVSNLQVKRILALANLNTKVRALYADDKIDVGTIRALTLADAKQQDQWLTLYNDENEYTPIGNQLKAWLSGGERIETGVALFDLQSYDGVILNDLFGEHGIFADPDIFWRHQNKALAEQIAEYKQQGWTDTVILERGEGFYTWQYAERSLEQDGKVFVEIGHSGTVTFHVGYLTEKDAKRVDAILNGDAEDDKIPVTAKPEMSGPLKDYVSLHRHAMARASLLGHPATAMRLTVAHMIAGSTLWKVGAHKIGSVKDVTKESVETSKAHVAFEEERTSVRGLLGLDTDKQKLCGNDYNGISCVEVFAKLLNLSDDEVMRVMTTALADSLSVHDGLVEAIGKVVDIDMPTLWEPDEAFFEILRDKRVINAVVSEIAGEHTAESMLTDTGKKQKTVITNRIVGIGVDKPNKDWRPRWMQFPATSYLEPDDAYTASVEKEVARDFEKHQSTEKSKSVKKAA